VSLYTSFKYTNKNSLSTLNNGCFVESFYDIIILWLLKKSIDFPEDHEMEEEQATEWETYCSWCAGIVNLEAERCPHCGTVDFDPMTPRSPAKK
jgi:hypothetical protein